MYFNRHRKKRPEQTKLLCDKCGKPLTDFEILLGCLNCESPKVDKDVMDCYIHPMELEKFAHNENLIRFYSYTKGISIAQVKEAIARNTKGDSELLTELYQLYKDKVLK